ncbi:unnamed protein product [Phytomonas sp. Hart1]|nr:unnamed protein product [Phytomonas sp. Hart1]|eukprot:CCW69249.1 unnamed protein product [Phytomonas sp. isolate Hart1]
MFTENNTNIEVKQYTYRSGAVYKGTFDGVKRSGRGYWRHPKGEVYEGEYKNNKEEGLGVYKFEGTGKIYIGQWLNGKMNGCGVYFFNLEHTVYFVGNYVDDQRHGLGHYSYESGILTTQQWDMGQLIHEESSTPLEQVNVAIQIQNFISEVRVVAPLELGEVPSSKIHTFQFSYGATYTGQYLGTKKHGQGYWLHPEGDSYEGQFENNKHNGWGVYIVGRSGKKFVGSWRDGKMNGIGIYFFNPQETEYYIGNYRADLKHGCGMYHFAESGHDRLQTWEDGVLKEELGMDELFVEAYIKAIHKLIETVGSYAPNYEPIAFP